MKDEEHSVSKKEAQYFRAQNDNVKSRELSDLLSLYSIRDSERIYFRSFSADEYVELVHYTTTDMKEIIIKTTQYSSRQEKKTNSLNREYFIAKLFNEILGRSPKILGINQIIIEEKSLKKVEVLMEYKGESLGTEKYSSKTLQKIIYQLLVILKEMAEVGIAHFDIKPKNILWDKRNGKVSLIDFGCSVIFIVKEKIDRPLSRYLNRFVGFSEFFSPPEVLSRKAKTMKGLIPSKVDVFAFGMTMVDLLFKQSGKIATYSRDGTKANHAQFLEYIDTSLKGQEKYLTLIHQCLHYKKYNRLSIRAVLETFIKLFSFPLPPIDRTVEQNFKLAKTYMREKNYQSANILLCKCAWETKENTDDWNFVIKVITIVKPGDIINGRLKCKGENY